jgi:CBS domain containing-hemolysin-like protein
LVFRELGKIPAPGDKVTVEDVKITVQTVIGRRIRRVKIELLDVESPSDD